MEYDSSAGYLVTAFRLQNTVVPSVLRRWEFWFFMGIHVTIAWMYRYGGYNFEEKSFLHIGWGDIEVMAAITTFFQVFYTNSCYHRYMHLYNETQKLFGTLQDICGMLRLQLKDECQPHLRLCGRWLELSIVSVLLDLHGAPLCRENCPRLLKHGLVTREEASFLLRVEPQHHFICILSWVADAVKDSFDHTGGAKMYSAVLKLFHKFRFTVSEIHDTRNMPMPFQYFHLLKTAVLANLLLWAYVMAITDSIFSVFVYFMAEMMLMGLMELASQLSDPFGDDDVDFDLDAWCASCLADQVVLTQFEFPKSMPDFKDRAMREKAMRCGPREMNLW